MAHGGGSFSWQMAHRMVQQGFLPDVISSDLHSGFKIKTSWPVRPPHSQHTTMSKMLSLGMSLNDVIRASTYSPAKAIGLEDQLGSLQVGRDADASVLALEEGDGEFSDIFSAKTIGHKRLVPALTVRGGQVYTPDALPSSPICWRIF